MKLILALLLALAPAVVFAAESKIYGGGINGRYHGVPIPSYVNRTAIPVCYDFGCNTRDIVKITLKEWREVARWFEPAAATPAEEREQIRHAIGWMEVVVGRHTPTSVDLQFDEVNDINNREPGHLDCIDESVNTTTYLNLFKTHDLLRHHDVIEEAYRKALLDQHWAGQVRERATGTRYIFDSWFQPNGYLPVVQKSEVWEDISLLSAVIDSRAEGQQGKDQKKPSLWRRIFTLD